MNEFLTIAERDQRYGSAAEFEKFYRQDILPYLEIDQTAVNRTVADPPPMVYVIIGTTGREFNVVPFFLFDLPREAAADKLAMMVLYSLDKKRKTYFEEPEAKVIAVIGVCYAYMKIQTLDSEAEIKNLPRSIKNDPQAEEVVILLADFCQGEITSAMTLLPDRSCKLVTITQRAVVTGENRYNRLLGGLFKRAATYHHKETTNN